MRKVGRVIEDRKVSPESHAEFIVGAAVRDSSKAKVDLLQDISPAVVDEVDSPFESQTAWWDDVRTATPERALAENPGWRAMEDYSQKIREDITKINLSLELLRKTADAYQVELTAGAIPAYEKQWRIIEPKVSNWVTDRIRFGTSGPVAYPKNVVLAFGVRNLIGMMGDRRPVDVDSQTVVSIEDIIVPRMLIEPPDEGRERAGEMAAVEHLVTKLANRLGPDHLAVLVARRIWADIRAENGDVGGARTALTELVADLTRVLGAAHPETASARDSLSGLEAGGAWLFRI